MMMALGLFLFSVPTLAFDELKRRTDWRYARAARVGARDGAQFVGIGDETVTLTGTAAAELQEGEASLDQLRDMANSGLAWPLLDGAGLIYGAYVITALDERRRCFLDNGKALSIDFTIDLLRVPDEIAIDGAFESFSA